MTQEEAIKRIKAWNLDSDDMEVLEAAIPELRESENERIRKEILDFIQLCLSRTDFGSRSIALRKEDAEMFEKWIAYLEKQKEQKQEWSEEDERKIGRLRSIVNECASRNYALDVNGDYCEGDYAELDDWLKSLRLQPKQNASDIITPNKRFFQWIYDRLINVHNEDPNVDYMISFKERIEELPFDEPHWKPTDEQMEALDEYIYAKYPDTEKYSKAILSLKEELKKLI